MRIAFPSLFAVPLFAACVAPTPGNVRQVPDPVSTRYINPGTLAALPGFTHAVRIGSTLYVSGEVALDSTGRLVGPGDLRAQAAQAFANLATVLRIGGATPADVAKLTIYVVNFSPKNLDAIREAAPDFFPQRNPLRRSPVRQLSVEAGERLQLASDAHVPFRQVEATGHVTVHAGEILLPDQLQGVRHLLEQDRRVELRPPEALEWHPVGTGQESA